jgi:hypothetical protein
MNIMCCATQGANSCKCVGVSTPGGSLDRRVKLSLRAPAQMGWREMEHKGGDHGSCYPAPEWVRLQ